MKTGIEMIAEERQRQIEVEGYSQQHDSQHNASEFVYAAISYAESAKVGINCMEIGNTNENEIMRRKVEMGRNYPFGWDFKPSTDVRDLVKAGALIAAAIDRIKESEDEKVRKGIIELVKQSSEILNKKNQERMLAWLEKKASYTTIVETGDGGINALVTRELPTDSEQKPADKVESHFHVEKGKWYMCIKNNVGITKGNAYYGISDGYIIDDNGRKYNCKNWAVFQGYLRLWDITIDARDGDVLYLQHDGKEHIIIYKGVIKERFRTFVSAYCAYNGIVDAFCFADVSRYADLAYGGIVPATKEQRDTLLKAMADAGYTFDFEKKKLKNIVQKTEENKKDK